MENKIQEELRAILIQFIQATDSEHPYATGKPYDQALASLTSLIDRENFKALLKRVDAQMEYLNGFGAVIQYADLSFDRQVLESRLKTLTPGGSDNEHS
jgi:hypothetical protein